MTPTPFLRLCSACHGTGHGERTGSVCFRCGGDRLEPCAHPLADAHDLLEARCAELERENRTAAAEGFLHGRTEAAAMVREVRLRFELLVSVTVQQVVDVLTDLEAGLKGDA